MNKYPPGNKINIFFPTLVFCFLYISFATFLVSYYYSTPKPEQVVFAQDEKTLGLSTAVTESKPLQPQIVSGIPIPDISAWSAYAIEAKSHYVLYEKNESEQVFPASTAKIVTALVSLDYYDLQSVVSVGKLNVEGQKMGLVGGEQITVENLLSGLLVLSANDAAEVLASNYPGGRDIFIAQMNVKAKELGMVSTIFTNPSGLDSSNQTTTAKDLIKASEVAMENDTFSKLVATKDITVSSIDGAYKHRLYNINRLLWEVDGVKGVKTGKTDGAQENLITYIERDGVGVYIAVLGSNDRFNDSKKLIDYIFAKYSFE
ncbi:MAG TPA: hypothetical protein VI819_05100 [Patescibacteria group bacterium]|nr:hypothetical protein [Patescibacteria group bacterium]